MVSLLPASIMKQMSFSTFFPYHHLVSDEDVLHVKHLYAYKNVKQFTNDLDYLLKHNRVVSVDEIVDAVKKGKQLPGNTFLLTFDDGFREIYDIVEPILSSKGVPSIFFINPAFVDNRELFYRCKISLIIDQILRRKNQSSLLKQCSDVLSIPSKNLQDIITNIKKISNLNKNLVDNLGKVLDFSFQDYLHKKEPFLKTEQLKELQKKGYTIGAHSWDHPYYNLMPLEQQLQQTLESCQYVREHFSPSNQTFSFPHFDKGLPQSFFDELFQEEFQIDLLFGTQNQKFELNNRIVHRFNAERPEVSTKKQLKGIIMLMALRKLLKSGQIKRQEFDYNRVVIKR